MQIMLKFQGCATPLEMKGGNAVGWLLYNALTIVTLRMHQLYLQLWDQPYHLQKGPLTDQL
jgi:hypothetical protein